MESLAASKRAGKWYPPSLETHTMHKLPATERVFVFKTHGHRLPTVRVAHQYFTANNNLPSTCRICHLADDDSTHWYSCLGLQVTWKKEFALADKKAPLKGGLHWADRPDRERLAQGLVPRDIRLECSRTSAARETTQAAHRVWRTRDTLWKGVLPREWILGHHQCRNPPPKPADTSLLLTRMQWAKN